MKILRLPSFCKRTLAAKKNLSLITLLFCLLGLNAQVKLRVEPGFPIKTNSENLGLLLNAEPNIQVSKNSVIGLRFGLGLNTQKLESNFSSQFIFDEQNDNAVISFMPTFDYYLNENYTRPFVGLGLGYCLVSSVALVNPNPEVPEGSVNNQLGFLIRGGFEMGKTKFGLEYNLIPQADIKIPNGETIGTAENSYLGISIGFLIGHRKNITGS